MRQQPDDTYAIRRFLEGVNSLAWLDGLIGFAFRLIAKLAEPFLAFGLIASAIDYGSHGTFLGGHTALLTLWVVTQGIALEGSGGIALAMSFEAKAGNDLVKARIQRALAIALMLVGGVMFFVELSAAVKGFSESTMPDWYVYLMNGARAIVSLGYIAVCRTRYYRFSGIAPEVIEQHLLEERMSELVQQVNHRLLEVQSSMQQQVQHMLQAQSHLMEQRIQAQLQTVVQHCSAAIANQVPPLIEEQLQGVVQHLQDGQSQALSLLVQRFEEVCMTVHEIRTITEVRTADELPATAAVLMNQPDEQLGSVREKRLCAGSSEPLRLVQSRATIHADEKAPDDLAAEPVHIRVPRFIAEQLEQGRQPSLSEIMNHCSCSRNTAIRYRRELLDRLTAQR
jgi:hypothetical protein